VTARFIIGDTREVIASLPDGSVDLVLTSPPFLALRSYLPADHPDKAKEIGSEPDPATFIATMLELSAEWRRVLATHGSIAVEFGDTYSGSGGGGGDYQEGGLREGQPGFVGSARASADAVREANAAHWRLKNANRDAWPLPKSLALIPELYRVALAYGRHPLTGEPSPAGRWRVRNVVRWVRPNPPVGALGDKFRPATSDLVIACTAGDRWFDLDAVRTEAKTGDRVMWQSTVAPTSDRKNVQKGDGDGGYRANNPAGAPPLDWWEIVPKGYEGSHYATFPPELCVRPIEAMCPRRVCRTCGKPSRRETDIDYTETPARELRPDMDRAYGSIDGKRHNDHRATDHTTTGWTSCGCPGTDGIRLDGYHTGTGWRPGIVLDPFAGTGTTLAVATGYSRDAIGVDLDPRNADLAMDRVGGMFLTVESHNPKAAA